MQKTLSDISDARLFSLEHYPFLQTLLVSSSNPFAVKDLNSRYIVINEAVQRLFGLPESELLGRSDRELLPAAIAERVCKNDEEVISAGKQKIFEEEIHFPGGVRYFNTTKSPLFNHDGVIIGLVLNAQDITEQKENETKLAETLGIMRSVMHSTDDLISIVTRDKVYRYVNPAMAHFLFTSFGIEAINILNKPLSQIGLPGDVAEFVNDCFNDVLNSGNRVSTNFSWNNRYYQLTFIPELAISGQVENIISICKDMTESREKDELKNMFINMARHELKNPLTVLKGYQQVAMRTMQDGKVEEAKSFLDKACQQIDKVSRMLNDMLNVENMQVGMQLELSSFNIRDLMQPLLLYCRSISEKHQLLILRCDSAILSADRFKLEQVLHNLVNNAVKYSDVNGVVELSVVRKPDHLLISLSDTGPGVPDSEKQLVFEPYYRRVLHKKKDGVGMGLYIVRQIVNMHNGDIWIEDNPADRGSVFNVKLPL